MVTSRKVALSLLISIILFCVFTAVAFTGLFDLLEAHFYNPSITAYMVRENRHNAEVVDRLLGQMKDSFSQALRNQVVRNSFLSSQSAQDISARSRIFDRLLESFDGIQWIRLIDSGGKTIHFSTYAPDILNLNGSSVVYRNYDDPDIPFEIVEVKANEPPKLTFDEKSERIFLSFPLYDSYDLFWGVALFSVSKDAIMDHLVSKGRIRFGQELMIISNPMGLVFCTPSTGEILTPGQISSAWREEREKASWLVSPDSGFSITLISTIAPQGFFVGRLANEAPLSLPDGMKFILLVSFFLTVFLTCFLLFNLKQDPVSIVQTRLKQLQISLFGQFFELKGELDMVRWIRELEQRRSEVNLHIKQGLKFSPANTGDEIDVLINNSWDDFLLAMGKRRADIIDEEKLKATLKDILVSLPVAGASRPSVSNPAETASKSRFFGKTGLLQKASVIFREIQEAKKAEEIETPEELEELEAAETFEEIGHLEEIGVPDQAEEHEVEDIAALASRIEFSSDPETESAGDESIDVDLEVVSPFSSMLNDFASSDLDEDNLDEFMEKIVLDDPFAAGKSHEELNETQESGIEEIPNRGQSIITTPFSTLKGGDEIETLEALPDDEDEKIIKERNGVPFISVDSLDAGHEKTKAMDKDFKELVDSVIK